MDIQIDRWTRARAVALHDAYRDVFPEMSNERFAQELGISINTLYEWRRDPDPDKPLRPSTQDVLKTYFDGDAEKRISSAPEKLRTRFWDLLTERGDRIVRTTSRPEPVVARLTPSSTAVGIGQVPASGVDDIAVIQSFRSADVQVGGGYLYSAVVQYLQHELGPRILLADGSTAVFAAAGGLTEMAGWMAHDSGRDDTSNRHFDRALDLARLGPDRQQEAHNLASLSHLASHRRHYRDAISFAQEGREALNLAPQNPGLKARLLAMEARGFAGLKESRSCGQLLLRAEQALDGSPTSDSSPWISNFDEASLASEAGRCMRKLSQYEQAKRLAERIIHLRKGRARSHALGQLALALTLVSQPVPDLDHACAAANVTLDTTQSLASYLVIQQLQELYRRLQPYRTNPTVGGFVDYLHVTLTERQQVYRWLAKEEA